ncbi:MAG TPA: response regulator [Candidatus Dormibacteraeota bacterium]|nr:response regulator [Candidatus Dormibacteraeota bacterium]
MPEPRIQVVVVDDKPDVVDLVALGFGLDPRFEVVGVGFTGADAVRLTEKHRPAALVIDLDMPIMSGHEAIPLVRTASPETRIVVFTGTRERLSGAAEPDAHVLKGSNLKVLLETIARLATDDLPKDIVEIDLGEIPLESAVAAFDSWVGLHVRIREAISREPPLTTAELGGASAADLLALNGLFLRLGDQLVRAAQAGDDTVHVAFRIRRRVAGAVRRALVILGDDKVLAAFYESWGHESVPASRAALEELRHRLIAQLPH